MAGAASTPKRHHYVPILLLKNFCAQDGQLHVFNKKTGDIHRATPENAFLQNHLYSYTMASGDKNPALEIAYSKLEDHTAPIVRKIIHAISSEKYPKLSPDERRIWDHFFVHQYKRTPEIHAPFFTDENWSRHIEAVIPKIAEKHGMSEEQVAAKFDDPKAMKRVLEKARIHALSRSSEVVEPALGKVGINIIVIAKPHKSFVIGSVPILRLDGPSTTILKNTQAEVWLPIAHNIAIGPSWNKTGENVFWLEDGDAIRRANQQIFRQSNIVASRSVELLASLAAPK
ncbi:DUF4238 domain-containing protein [Gimibacter soli]|uniref:DUF4238 domain-containing protein n=1 Tax=Gimibacter soli TaxID=3024400 RepID=A0AAE9XSW8_9PROT|nr:DUF4238 domain-containing protein [Gimibacter soli]WCL55684.1 DUF4238 domain-containing protein [Gimibacter soli]